MLTLVIWFLALITVIGSSNTVERSPAQTIDLNKIVRLFANQQQLYNPSKQRILRLAADSSDSDYTSDSNPDSYSDDSDDTDDSDDDSKDIATEKRKKPLLNLILNAPNRKGKMNFDGKLVRSRDEENARLARQRIIDLIEKVSANEKKKNDRITNRKGKPNHGRSSYLFRNDNYDSINNNIQKQILEQLLSQTSNVEERQLKPKKRLIPNRLTPTVTMDDVKKYYENKNNEVTDLEDYSKVYIVLNPQAVKNSKNKNTLNDLISKVLSLSSQTPKREPEQVEPFRYKGFAVKGTPLKEINHNIARMGGERDDEKLPPPAAEDRLDGITAMPEYN